MLLATGCVPGAAEIEAPPREATLGDSSGVTTRQVLSSESTGDASPGSTVDPRAEDAPTTDPVQPDTTGTTLPRSRGGGALLTPTGILVPVRGRDPAGPWLVGSPCGTDQVIGVGERVSTVQVLIDPGHGGDAESGTIGPNGLRESTLNLDVSRRVESWLRAHGVTVRMTRRADHQVSLATRAELAEAIGPKLFLSIHHNGGGVYPSKVPGTLAFHQQGSKDSRRLAGLLFEELQRALVPLELAWVRDTDPGAMAVRDERDEDYYAVLRRTPHVPAVIVEPMFLTNRDEAVALMSSEVRDIEAEAIGTATLRYLRSTAPGTGFRQARVLADTGDPGEPETCEDPPLG